MTSIASFISKADRVLKLGTYAKVFLLAFVLAFSAGEAANAKQVLAAKSFRLVTPDSDVVLSSLKVNFYVRCEYRSGLFWPEPKSCGSYNKTLTVSNDGVVTTPAVETFSGIWNSQKLDNYEISLSVYNGDEFIFSLNAIGAAAISSLANQNQVISFIKIEGTELDVTAQGAPLFDTELSKRDRASLTVVTSEVAGGSKRDIYSYLLVSLFDGGIKSYENMLTRNPPKRDLIDARSVTLKPMYFATEGPLVGKKINLTVTYSQMINYQHLPQYRYSKSFEITNDALKNLRAIDLEPTK